LKVGGVRVPAAKDERVRVRRPRGVRDEMGRERRANVARRRLRRRVGE